MSRDRSRSTVYDPGNPGDTLSLGEGRYRVQSFTDPGTWYDVDLGAATCTCPDFTRRTHAGNYLCKHLRWVRDQQLGDEEEAPEDRRWDMIFADRPFGRQPYDDERHEPDDFG